MYLLELATHERALWMLKKKYPEKRRLNERIVFQVELGAFENSPRRSIRKLNSNKVQNVNSRQQNRDSNMRNDVEEEEKKSDYENY